MLYALPLGLVLGLLLGGRLAGLADLRFRWTAVFLLGLAVQLALFSEPVTRGIGAFGPPIYVASTALVLVALAANARTPGVPIVLVGATSNLAAILANGGYMPAGGAALEALNRTLGGEYSNSASLAHPALEPLTDIFAMPAWIPFANVFSIGDVVIGIGVVVVVVIAMRAGRPGGRVHVAGRGRSS